MRQDIWSIVLLFATIALPGCGGPRYQTLASYTPPATESGQQCIMQCLSGRQTCRRHTDLDAQQCRNGAYQEAQIESLKRAAEYQIDLQRHQAGMIKHPPRQPRSVRLDYHRCDGQSRQAEGRCAEDYDACYQTCGGAITHSTHCVANCE